MMKLLALVSAAFCFASPSFAAHRPAPGNELARKQALQRSAEAWLRREVLPGLRFQSGVTNIYNAGVTITENAAVLPPDLGGPLPTSPVEVLVKVYFSGSVRDARWGDLRPAQCQATQRLLALNDGHGRALAIRAGQPLRAPLACASGVITNPGDYGNYGWK